jgi:fatty-acyl-CoA synthase
MMPIREVFYTPLSPLTFLERSAFVYPEKRAVVYKDKSYSYAEFYKRVTRLAWSLKRAGIQKGDRVAFLCPNIPPMLEAHYGVPLAGGILVSINTRLSAREILYIVNHSGSKILFVDTALTHLIEGIIKELKTAKTVVNIVDIPDGKTILGVNYEEFLAQGGEDFLPSPVEDEMELISINYTSGTTGQPKGVMYHHRGAYLNALGQALEVLMSNRTRYLWTLPMFHCNGWCFTWAVTAVGGTHVCLRAVDAAEIFRLIEKEDITHFCAAPIVLTTLANYPGAANYKFSRRIQIMTAGAPPSPTIIEAMEGMGAEVIHIYGLTETYGPMSICAWKEEWDALPTEKKAAIKARQGVAYIHAAEMRVVDNNMQDVPRDGKVMGEIIMRGNITMKGYFNDPAATAKAFEGGWFHSGDLAVMDPDGYAAIRDRAKDIIISGGENISTVEVENTIYKHPDVLEVAVVAVPDEKWGEAPKAFVGLKPGKTLTEKDIIEFCRQNMARFKCPKVVEFCELPKTATGKIKKFELREKEWRGWEKRVH